MGNLLGCADKSKESEYMNELFDLGDEEILKALVHDPPQFEKKEEGIYELVEKDIGTFRRITTFNMTEETLTIRQLKNNEDSETIRTIPFSRIIKLETKQIGDILDLKDVKTPGNHEGMIRIHFYEVPSTTPIKQEEESKKKEEQAGGEEEEAGEAKIIVGDDDAEEDQEQPPIEEEPQDQEQQKMVIIEKGTPEVEVLYRRDLLEKHIQPLCDEIKEKVFGNFEEIIVEHIPPVDKKKKKKKKRKKKQKSKKKSEEEEEIIKKTEEPEHPNDVIDVEQEEKGEGEGNAAAVHDLPRAPKAIVE